MDVYLPVGGSPDDVIALIDNDDNSGGMKLIIEHDHGGAGKDLMQVWESGRVIVHGPVETSGTIKIRTNVAGDDPCYFDASSSPPPTTTTMAKVTNTGDVRFTQGADTQGGLRLPVRATTPQGSLSGDSGDLVIYHNGANYELWTCYGGTDWNTG